MEIKYSILIVDDDPKARKTLSDILKSKGYKPITAATGKEALDRVKEARPAAALVDLRLEDMSGLEVVRELKECSPGTECIVITGYASKASAIEAVNLGAYGYVQKPYDMDQLLLSVQRAIEKKEAKETLRVSEERYRTIFDQAADSIMVIDAENGALVEFNEKAHTKLGYTRKEFEKLKTPDFEAIESSEEVARHIEKIIKVGGDTFETKHRTKAGEIRDIQVSSRAISIQGKDFVQSIGRDITELKRAEKALETEKEKFQVMVEESPLGISLISKEGNYKYVNPKFVEMFGYTLEEIPTGREWFRIAYPDKEYRNQAISAWITAIHETKVGQTRTLVFNVTCKDGSEKVIQFLPVTMQEGEQFIIYEDITEQKKIEARLVQSQKMEAVGTLAGGIAHDFNNILTIIMGNSDLMLMDMDENHPFQGNTHEIRQASRRAASLTRQLLAFSRKQVIHPKILNLNEIVMNIKKMLKRLIKEDINLKLKLHTALWRVEMDPGQIEQAIVNLVVNARDAMPKGGSLIIETENVNFSQDFSSDHGVTVKPGSYVVLRVRDTGIGIDEETLSRVFEPFFTTKEIGKGTGLGLATVYGIVKQNNGYILVKSQLGEGTTFELYLPKAEGDIKYADEEKPSKAISTCSETILVVEDDDRVRNTANKIIMNAGYRVLEARNGESALEVSKGYKGTIHLMLTDVVMPGMSGRELAKILEAQRPDMRVLYMSGYTDDSIAQYGVLEPGIEMLDKPFTALELVRKAKEVLDR